MLLERQFDPKYPVNIRHLTVETPAKQAELPFDPEREIGQAYWERMRNQLGAYRERRDWLNYLPPR